MGMLIVQHRVRDYRKWRRAYDGHASVRRKAGLDSGQVYRGADDPHKIAIVFKVKDADKAKNFVESDELRKVMRAAGVVGKPAVTLHGTGPQARSRAVPRQVGGKGPSQEKPPEASADVWARYQRAVAAWQKGPAKPGTAAKL
jgi:hypothetical protein